MDKFLGARLKTRFAKMFGDEIPLEYSQKFHFNKISDIPFDPLTYLNSENGEVYSIEMTDEQINEFINPYSEILESTASINPILSTDLNNVKNIFYIEKTQQKKKIFFCRMFPSNFIERTSWISVTGNEINIKTEENLLDFSFDANAFFDEETKKLYFRKFDIIKPIFPGIEIFYRQATDVEIGNFVTNSLFSPDSLFHDAGLQQDRIGVRNKKKITYLLDKGIGEILTDPVKREAYRLYASNCSLPFNLHTDGKLKIQTEQELEQTLNMLMERYYRTYILEEKMVLADSVRYIQSADVI